MRMTPMVQAHTKEYTGPSSTAHTMLIRWAVGHMPSTRRMGEMTTPTATSIASTTRRRREGLRFIKKTPFPKSFRGKGVGSHMDSPPPRRSPGAAEPPPGQTTGSGRSKLTGFLSCRNTASHRCPVVYESRTQAQGAPPRPAAFGSPSSHSGRKNKRGVPQARPDAQQYVHIPTAA